MAYRDIEKRRRNDLARFHRRSEARRAAGLCLKCGKVPPTPDRTLCEPCLEKRRAADRARSAKLRAEGKPRRDPERARLYERERSRREHAERKAAGICTKCGRAPARPERTTCEPCAEQHRARDRARHARAKAEGIPYGGRDPEARRRAGRKRSRRRSEARKRPACASAAATSRPRRPGDVRTVPRGSAGRETRAPCRAPGGGPLRPMRSARARRQDLLRSLRQGPPRSAGTSTPSGKPTAGAMPSGAPGAIAPAAASRPTARPSARPAAMPPAPATTPAGPPGSASSVRPPPTAGRPTARPAPSPRPNAATARQSTPPGAPICRSAGQGPLRRMRGAVAGGGALRAVFAQAPRELGGVSRHPRSGTRAGR